MHSSPQSKPSGNCSSITDPGANGKFVMLRGSEIRTVLPFSSSMLAMVSESGRRPQRSAPGVAAEEQHVVAAVAGVARLAAAEHRLDQVALRADQVGAEQQRAGDEQAQRAVDADHRAPVRHGQRQRLADPPGVDEQERPAHRAERSARCAGTAGCGCRRPGRTRNSRWSSETTRTSEPGRQGGDPDPHREPADPPVPGGQLRRARDDQRHRHQGEGTAEAHAGCALGCGGGSHLGSDAGRFL